MAGPSRRGDRQFDVAVLGVSGFTGKFVLKELVSQLVDSPQIEGLNYPIRIAAAGRSRERVKEHMTAQGVAEEGEEEEENAGGSSKAAGRVRVSIVEVDVMVPSSLSSFCASTSLVLDCVGPFRFYGPPVVSACVENGTDYLDVSGEPEFMERMVANHHAAAVSSGSLVVSSCGFDSVPAELGVQASLRALQPEPGGSHPTATVSSYLTCSCPLGLRGHYGTWDSLVHSLASVDELRKLRKAEAKKAGPSASSAPQGAPGASKKKGKGGGGAPSMLPKWSPEKGAYILPFPGADVAVVRRSLAFVRTSLQPLALSRGQGEASAAAGGGGGGGRGGGDGGGAREPLLPGSTGEGGASSSTPSSDDIARAQLLPAAAFESVKYSAFFTLKTAFQAFLFVAFGGMLSFLARSEGGRKLLLKYPKFFSHGVFSKEGPTQEQLDATTFTMHFDAECRDGEGGSLRKVGLDIHGPEMGYVVTPWIIVQCALTVLRSRSSLPRGGVLTPAVAFAGSSLEQSLHERGMRFEVSS